MDIDRNAYNQALFTNTLLPIVITLVILTILLALYIVSKNEADILSLKSEFISLAAHDLRSPLSGVKWLSEILLNSTPILSTKQKEYVSDIGVTSNNLLTLINDMLNAATVQSGKTLHLTTRKRLVQS